MRVMSLKLPSELAERRFRLSFNRRRGQIGRGDQPSRDAGAEELQAQNTTVVKSHAVAVDGAVHLNERHLFGFTHPCHDLHAFGYM